MRKGGEQANQNIPKGEGIHQVSIKALKLDTAVRIALLLQSNSRVCVTHWAMRQARDAASYAPFTVDGSHAALFGVPGDSPRPSGRAAMGSFTYTSNTTGMGFLYTYTSYI